MMDAINLGFDYGKGVDRTDRGTGEDSGTTERLENPWRNQGDFFKNKLSMSHIVF